MLNESGRENRENLSYSGSCPGTRSRRRLLRFPSLFSFTTKRVLSDAQHSGNESTSIKRLCSTAIFCEDISDILSRLKRRFSNAEHWCKKV